jgi:hypothetical protein
MNVDVMGWMKNDERRYKGRHGQTDDREWIARHDSYNGNDN